MKNPLGSSIEERIEEAGPITFAEFMRTALYDPRFGYYTRGPERSGWGGHFITSPQLDPAFGELWSVAFERIWAAAGRPATFELIELGPGEGGLSSAVLAATNGTDFGDALHLTLVERAPQLQQRQQERLVDPRVGWCDDLGKVPVAAAGCIFANEILDNQPVHLVRMAAGQLQEAFVVSVGDTLALQFDPPTALVLKFLERHPMDLPTSHLVELSPEAEGLVATAASKIAEGAVIFVDYGDEAAELAANPQGTLVCYSRSGTDTAPLEDPGEKDLTVFADWTMVKRVLRSGGCRTEGPLSQRTVLRRLGAPEANRRLREEYERALVEKRGGDALRALSRRQALGALLDEGGLGRLEVIAGLKGLQGMPSLFEVGE